MLTTIKIEDTHCCWNELFTDEEIDKIIDYCESLPKVDGLIGTQAYSETSTLNTEVRYSKISWIDRNEESEWFFSKIQAANNKLNSKFFGFDIENIFTLQYTVYDENNSHYDWHWDSFVGNNLNDLYDHRQRKVTSVLQLDNENDYEGGFLEILPCGECKTIERKKGLMVTFPSFVVHRVTPVTKGLRRTLVAWFTGPDWR